MARVKTTGTVTIANGQSLSGAINLGAHILCAIVIPAAWTAAALSFQVSDDLGLTWQDMYDSTGTEVTIPLAAAVAGQRISINTALFAGADFLKIRSGTGGAPVAQGAARTITLISRKLYATP
jgi:hypothetical protein